MKTAEITRAYLTAVHDTNHTLAREINLDAVRKGIAPPILYIPVSTNTYCAFQYLVRVILKVKLNK